jgi:hypothetical protein
MRHPFLLVTVPHLLCSNACVCQDMLDAGEESHFCLLPGLPHVGMDRLVHSLLDACKRNSPAINTLQRCLHIPLLQAASEYQIAKDD